MKIFILKMRFLITGIIFLMLFSGCEDYLAKTDNASVPEADVFQKFQSYQGFVSNMYNYVFDMAAMTNNADLMWSNFEETVTDVSYQAEWKMEVGSYPIDVTSSPQNPLRYVTSVDAAGPLSTNAYARRSMWDEPWYCIRIANIALEKINLLKEATQDEKNAILGQAYFFRGFSHFELVKVWGGLPYLTEVLEPNDEMKFSRLSIWECYEKIVADLDSAVKYLPVNWNTNPAGKPTIGRNDRLLTKGAALGMKAKALLYAGSPRENGTMTGNYQYNKDYCKLAAEAAWQVINLTDPLAEDPTKKVYELIPWDYYSRNFYSMDFSIHGEIPGYKEFVFQNPLISNQQLMGQGNGANLMSLISIGVFAGYMSPTYNLIQKFEMADGTKPPAIGTPGFDPTSWQGRDPRMHSAFFCDGDSIIFGSVLPPDGNRFAAFYNSPGLGRDRNGPGQTAGYSESGFGLKKFIPKTYNNYDDKKGGTVMGKYRFVIPKMRLAEVYLFFAEAANEAYGPTVNVPGTSMSAVDAVNVVRTRAKMPNVRAEFLSDTETFRKRIYNERSVELCLEGHRFYDVRRYYIGHLDTYDGLKIKDQLKLDFDKNHTFFSPGLIRPIVFNLRDYWLPLPTDQVNLYQGFFQNPGW